MRLRRSALLYAARKQDERRNVSEAVLYDLFTRVDKKKNKGGDRRSVVSRDTTDPGRSRDETAATLNRSAATVSRMRTIHDYAAETGDTSIEDASRPRRRGLPDRQGRPSLSD